MMTLVLIADVEKPESYAAFRNNAVRDAFPDAVDVEVAIHDGARTLECLARRLVWFIAVQLGCCCRLSWMSSGLSSLPFYRIAVSSPRYFSRVFSSLSANLEGINLLLLGQGTKQKMYSPTKRTTCGRVEYFSIVMQGFATLLKPTKNKAASVLLRCLI